MSHLPTFALLRLRNLLTLQSCPTACLQGLAGLAEGVAAGITGVVRAPMQVRAPLAPIGTNLFSSLRVARLVSRSEGLW